MYLEDYISELRKEYPSTEFKTHFTTWLPIMKKISEKFISRDPNHPFTNWSKRIVDEYNVGVYTRFICRSRLNQLPDSSNYFVLGEQRISENQKILLYEAAPRIIPILLGGFWGNVYIVDKKYNWLTCFSPDGNGNYLVRRSGPTTTPVEALLC